MAFRRLIGIRLFFVLVFGVVVLLVQMIALSRLNTSQSSLPWIFEDVEVKEQQAIHLAQKTAKPPLEHENPAHASETEVPSSKPLKLPRSREPPIKFSRGWNDRVLNQVVEVNISTTPERQTASLKRQTASLPTPTPKRTKSPPVQATKALNPFTFYPLPEDLADCSIVGKKDALSAISRAKSTECKDLIKNLTCLQKANRLYDTEIMNQCPLGRDPGRGVQRYAYSDGQGPAARVVFLLSVHGRAYRQVKRLLKAIYHTDHYYYIHVDSRSDYLHRKLYEELSDLPNVYFPSWRMATIWGGASLLQMLLRSMEDLEYVLTDWTWDYFINLSESDYPLKTNEELQKFLRVHRGENFVKTHGGDIKKFIQKQGLDRTFVECDNHMWRVDTRPLPPDITVDGGSDWIAIHRNYSRYLVTSKDPYIIGLRRYYEFSLLPAESFFHTVIRNGPMCGTFVKTNLRVTNWNRKLGCRCQYKHIVDWCGCSPNDFLPRDMTRLRNPGDHHFFARKFEAIVNLDVINQLDAHLYDPYPSDTTAMTSYWESVYHMDDDVTKPSNARYSTYQSFLRHSLKLLYSEQSEKGGGEGVECGIPKQAMVKEVSVLRQSDEFKGLIVTLRDALSTGLEPPEFEIYYTPIYYFKRFNYENDLANRILALEVGSEWDGKESMFRNHGGILGAWDEPVTAVRLTAGRQGTINIIWDDPVGERVAKYPMKLESAWFVSFHKPKVERPIRPGVWTVTLEMLDGALLMQTKFLVVPITHENKEPLAMPQAVNARRTNTVKPSMDSKEFARWKSNVSKSGTQLEQWLDEMVGKYWSIEGYCRTNVGESGSRCSWIQDCATTSWSTYSPDPKSDIGEVQPNGRIR